MTARSLALMPSKAAIEAFECRYCDVHGGRIDNTRQKGVVRIRTPRNLVDGKTVKPPGGVLCSYTVCYADAHDHTFFEELFPVFVSVDGEASLEHGRTLVREVGEEVQDPQANDRVAELVMLLDDLEQAAQQAAAGEAERGHQRLQAKINRQADACLKSLEKFREAKRQRLQLSVLDYEQRLLFGEDMDTAIRRAQYELDGLDDECERRRRQIEERRHVQMHAPGLLNVALLLT